jgi:hypothetical protein
MDDKAPRPNFAYFDNGKARYWPTCAAVIVFAVASATKSSYGILVYEGGNVTNLILPIAGTVVALALPAAQLAQSSVQNFMLAADDLLRAPTNLSGLRAHLIGTADEYRRSLEALRCVIHYSVLSFLFALIGALAPFGKRGISPNLAVADLIAMLATGFLVAAVLWFLPVIRSSFDFSKIERIIARLPP